MQLTRGSVILGRKKGLESPIVVCVTLGVVGKMVGSSGGTTTYDNFVDTSI